MDKALPVIDPQEGIQTDAGTTPWQNERSALLQLSGWLDIQLSGYLDAMAGSRSKWQDGRRAWARLNGWHRRDGKAPAHPESGDAAIRALEDVRLVRGLLETAELIAVETARRHEQSWTAIATAVGVSRQAAWEKWREVDPGDPPQ